MAHDPITAVALLTAGDVERLGASLKRVFPFDDADAFYDLLFQLDEADLPDDSLAVSP